MKHLYYVHPSTLYGDMRNLGTAIREESKILGKPIQVMFEKAKQKKTLPQNSYFHLLANMVCKETGEDIEDFKYRLKLQIGYYVEVMVENVAEKRPKSLSKASLEDLILFIDAVMTVCDLLEIKFMLPDEYYRKIGAKQ